MLAFPPFAAAQAYWTDAAQRTALFLDILRERGNIYLAQAGKDVPHVLGFPAELVADGRTLARPVNYALVRIVPPDGTVIDPTKAPVIVVDPRAGHGPGIGGMKQESQIGMAMAAGRACYFIGFTPEPMPGQTIEDVWRAEAGFVEAVAARHPEAESRPVVIGNCQAGWQIMMMAACNPGKTGPIMLAGSPLAYWAGVRGKNPMRYLGGLLGGTWMTAMAGDLGAGIFDGANLVANFESLNPANTCFQKAYNVYSRVDTERERFLEFETWWGSPVLLNAGEMQWIADNLFVGNRLARGQIVASDGTRIDLRNIDAPVIVFCSWGDNITPPQQALGWVTELYETTDDLVAAGQTIVYTMHDSVGHLGIFVSGKVATREHGEFVACMDMIEAMPPGLYEAVITEVAPDTANPALVHGKYLFRLEARTLDDIRALGGNDAADEQRFATAARVSEVNLGLYRAVVAPVVQALATPQAAEAGRALHPNRMRFAAFSDRNPWLAPVKLAAAMARANRQPVAADNPFVAVERAMAQATATWLRLGGETRDSLMETAFLTPSGSPVLQALVGLGAEAPMHQVQRDLLREATETKRRAAMEHMFGAGGLAEAGVRALVYVRLPVRWVDERGFAALRALQKSSPAGKRMTLAQFKQMLREQFLLLRMDEARAVAALPGLLPVDAAVRRRTLEALRTVLTAAGPLEGEAARRWGAVEAIFATGPKAVAA